MSYPRPRILAVSVHVDGSETCQESIATNSGFILLTRAWPTQLDLEHGWFSHVADRIGFGEWFFLFY